MKSEGRVQFPFSTSETNGGEEEEVARGEREKKAHLVEDKGASVWADDGELLDQGGKDERNVWMVSKVLHELRVVVLEEGRVDIERVGVEEGVVGRHEVVDVFSSEVRLEITATSCQWAGEECLDLQRGKAKQRTQKLAISSFDADFKAFPSFNRRRKKSSLVSKSGAKKAKSFVELLTSFWLYPLDVASSYF